MGALARERSLLGGITLLLKLLTRDRIDSNDVSRFNFGILMLEL
jgi:hypothetical protein